MYIHIYTSAGPLMQVEIQYWALCMQGCRLTRNAMPSPAGNQCETAREAERRARHRPTAEAKDPPAPSQYNNFL